MTDDVCVGIRNTFGDKKRLFLTFNLKNLDEILKMCYAIVEKFNQSDFAHRETKRGYQIFFFNLLPEKEWKDQLEWANKTHQNLISQGWITHHATKHESNIRFTGKNKGDLSKIKIYPGKRRLTDEEKTIIRFLEG